MAKIHIVRYEGDGHRGKKSPSFLAESVSAELVKVSVYDSIGSHSALVKVSQMKS
jgi:hypothetical protein